MCWDGKDGAMGYSNDPLIKRVKFYFTNCYKRIFWDKYKIVENNFAGYSVKVKKWYFPFWRRKYKNIFFASNRDAFLHIYMMELRSKFYVVKGD